MTTFESGVQESQGTDRSLEFRALDERYRVTDNMDVATFYKTISAKGKEVMRRRRRQGERMYKAPLGYKNARDQEGRSILVVDPQTYPLVQRARELRAQGMSIRDICAGMRSWGSGQRTERLLGRVRC